MTRNEFAQGLALLTGAVGKPMPDEQIAAWYALLNDLTEEQFKAAIVKTLQSHQYAGFPPIGTLRRNSGADGIPAKDRPLVAWNAVSDALTRLGEYHSPCFDDPVVNAAIRQLGGWPELTYAAKSDRTWLTKNFCDAYSALCSVALSERQTSRLTGTPRSPRTEKDRDGNTVTLREVVDVHCLTVPGTANEPITKRLELVRIEPPKTETPERSPGEEKDYLARNRDWYLRGLESAEKSAEQKSELAAKIKQIDERLSELDAQIAEARERRLDVIDRLKAEAAARQAAIHIAPATDRNAPGCGESNAII